MSTKLTVPTISLYKQQGKRRWMVQYLVLPFARKPYPSRPGQSQPHLAALVQDCPATSQNQCLNMTLLFGSSSTSFCLCAARCTHTHVPNAMTCSLAPSFPATQTMAAFKAISDGLITNLQLSKATPNTPKTPILSAPFQSFLLLLLAYYALAPVLSISLDSSLFSLGNFFLYPFDP